uniref:Uncharacterized protein n=1 Tax=Myoviridae sp. ctPkm1 TaxID=2825099 RepID=A0A8S5TYD3_9CAUD|nr:MAG TPA: hypothetical protein [Myoviridae sp. ctPkm1]DAO09804.1 MAG TPA: hypothetical protein [Caudoviricetes sp.]
MARFYYGRIKRGKLTIEDVPERWRAKVQALLDADNQG